MLGHAGAASGAPRHDILAFVQPTVLVALLQETPDGVVVLVRLGVVRVVPVHEVSESLRLLGDYVGESVNSVFALLHELANAVTLNLVLRLESVLLLDFNFYPESLPVVTVLEPLTVTLHVSEA